MKPNSNEKEEKNNNRITQLPYLSIQYISRLINKRPKGKTLLRCTKTHISKNIIRLNK